MTIGMALSERFGPRYFIPFVNTSLRILTQEIKSSADILVFRYYFAHSAFLLNNCRLFVPKRFYTNCIRFGPFMLNGLKCVLHHTLSALFTIVNCFGRLNCRRSKKASDFLFLLYFDLVL